MNAPRSAGMLDLAVEPSTMVPTMYRVVDRRIEVQADPRSGIDKVVTIWVESVDVALADFEPGQFAMVWAPGVGEVPISLSGTQGKRLGFTIRAVGATTDSLCDADPGAMVGLRGPFGRGWSQHQFASRHVVVAGGIGLAPLRLLIDRLLNPAVATAGPTGDEQPGDQEPGGPVEREVVVVIGARSPAEILYPYDIERWRERAEVHVTVDHPSRRWSGEVGLVTSTLSRLEIGEDTCASLCGPEIMMRLTGGDLVAAGADPADVEVSMERAMACAVAHCGRCQIGPVLVCRDGPVFPWTDAQPLMEVRRW